MKINKHKNKIEKTNKQNIQETTLHAIPRFSAGSFAVHIDRGSFAVRDHLRSNLGIISGLGIICSRGSFAALYSINPGSVQEKRYIC